MDTFGSREMTSLDLRFCQLQLPLFLRGCTAICQGAARLEVLSNKAVNMKKTVHPAMKRRGSRATLLEDILSDLIEVEDMLLELELKDSVRPLTIKETRLYKEVRARLRELITELTNDLAREHSAA
jgi:hypothetical protein